MWIAESCVLLGYSEQLFECVLLCGGLATSDDRQDVGDDRRGRSFFIKSVRLQCKERLVARPSKQIRTLGRINIRKDLRYNWLNCSSCLGMGA